MNIEREREREEDVESEEWRKINGDASLKANP